MSQCGIWILNTVSFFFKEEAITSHVILDPNENKNLLAHQFRQSALYNQINKEVKNLSVADNARDSVSIKYSYQTPFWYQVYANILYFCALNVIINAVGRVISRSQCIWSALPRLNILF